MCGRLIYKIGSAGACEPKVCQFCLSRLFCTACTCERKGLNASTSDYYCCDVSVGLCRRAFQELPLLKLWSCIPVFKNYPNLSQTKFSQSKTLLWTSLSRTLSDCAKSNYNCHMFTDCALRLNKSSMRADMHLSKDCLQRGKSEQVVTGHYPSLAVSIDGLGSSVLCVIARASYTDFCTDLLRQEIWKSAMRVRGRWTCILSKSNSS